MDYKELSLKERKQALAGQIDILTPLVEVDREIYEEACCPLCGGRTILSFDINKALNNNRPIPRHNSRCLECDCVFDPFSGIIINIGS